MIAAYTWSRAEDLTEFCQRHRIGREDTYTVLQSLVAPIWEGECYADMRLTLVLDCTADRLRQIEEVERARASAASEPEEPSDGTRPGEDAPVSEHEDLLYPDGIPF